MEILQKKVLKYLFKWKRRSATKTIYAALPIEEIELRAKLLALKIFGRFRESNASTLKKLIKNPHTKLIKSIADNYEILDGENVNFMKSSLFNDKKEEVFGPVAHRFNFARVLDVPLWMSLVSDLLLASFDVEDKDPFLNIIMYDNKLDIFVVNLEKLFRKKY